MVRGDVLRTIRLVEHDFRFDPELTAKLALRGIQIAEFPISYKPRSVKEGKKINWKDGLAAIFHIIKYNLFTKK